MTDEEKIKLFKKDFNKITKDWGKKMKFHHYNEYLNLWAFGFEACEREYDKKLQQFLDKKGI